MTVIVDWKPVLIAVCVAGLIFLGFYIFHMNLKSGGDSYNGFK